MESEGCWPRPTNNWKQSWASTLWCAGSALRAKKAKRTAFQKITGCCSRPNMGNALHATQVWALSNQNYHEHAFFVSILRIRTPHNLVWAMGTWLHSGVWWINRYCNSRRQFDRNQPIVKKNMKSELTLSGKCWNRAPCITNTNETIASFLHPAPVSLQLWTDSENSLFTSRHHLLHRPLPQIWTSRCVRTVSKQNVTLVNNVRGCRWSRCENMHVKLRKENVRHCWQPTTVRKKPCQMQPQELSQHPQWTWCMSRYFSTNHQW